MVTEENPLTKFIHYFSSWTKLKTGVAWLLKIKSVLKTLCLAQKNAIEMHGQNLDRQRMIDKHMHHKKVSLQNQQLTVEDLILAEKSFRVFIFQMRYPHWRMAVQLLEKIVQSTSWTPN